eukprot:jgi/Mesvir1/23434/Mv22292-RA.1
MDETSSPTAEVSASLRGFLPTGDKIHHIDVHPTLPWVLAADIKDNVLIWDWRQGEVIFNVAAASADEYRLSEAMLLRQAEMDPEYYGPRSNMDSLPRQERPGSVKCVRLFDEDTRRWEAWLQHAMTPTGGMPPEAMAMATGGPGSVPRALCGRRWLVTCCEAKATFLDLLSMRVQELWVKSALERVAITCLDFLPADTASNCGPFAAFGGGDGVIRLLSMQTWKVVLRLVGGHRGPIACLQLLYTSSATWQLLSGGGDGMVCVWDPQRELAGSSPSAPIRDMSPLSVDKVHDGGVHCISLAPGTGGGGGSGDIRMITSGADRCVAVWQLLPHVKEVARFRPIAKHSCHSVVPWMLPCVPQANLLLGVKDSRLWGAHRGVKGGGPLVLCDLNAYLGAGAVKAGNKVKVYTTKVHPLLPHLVIFGTNMGIFALELDKGVAPPALLVPAGVFPNDGPTAVVKSARNSFLLVRNQQLSRVSFQLQTLVSTPSMSGQALDAPRPPPTSTVMQVRQVLVEALPLPNDRATLTSNKARRYVGVLATSAHRYVVLRTATCHVVDQGRASSLAWDNDHHAYGVLEPAEVATGETAGEERRKSLLMSRNKAKALAVEKAQLEAAMAEGMRKPARVVVKRMRPDGALEIRCDNLPIPEGTEVRQLVGGSLLGVIFHARGLSQAPGASKKASSDGDTQRFTPVSVGLCYEKPFLFYSWDALSPVGTALPLPDWVEWDGASEMCAMRFTTGGSCTLAIFTARPTFALVDTLNLAGDAAPTHAQWHQRQLFLVTPTSVECVFVDKGAIGGQTATHAAEDAPFSPSPMDADVVVPGASRPPMLVKVCLASFSPRAMLPLPPPLRHDRPRAKEGDPLLALAAGGDELLLELHKEGGYAANVALNVEGFGTAGAADASASKPLAAALETRVWGDLAEEHVRPVGPLAMLGVCDGSIWVSDRYFNPVPVPLSHPGIRARCLAAYGDWAGALKWSARLCGSQRDKMAHFFAGMGDGMEAALTLPGTSKQVEFELCLQSANGRDLDRALACLDALARSHSSTQSALPSSDGTPAGAGLEGMGAVRMPADTALGAPASDPNRLFENFDNVAMGWSHDSQPGAAEGSGARVGPGGGEGAAASPDVGLFVEHYFRLADRASRHMREDIATACFARLIHNTRVLPAAAAIGLCARLASAAGGGRQQLRAYYDRLLNGRCLVGDPWQPWLGLGAGGRGISSAAGTEAALIGAILGDGALVERAFLWGGQQAEAALFAQVHKRESLPALMVQLSDTVHARQ